MGSKSAGSFDLESLRGLLQLAAKQSGVLSSPPSDARGDRGGDVDVAVSELDPLWPLRIPPEWKLCQQLHYDVVGQCWVLERQDSCLALDLLEDSKGLGRFGFRTTGAVHGDGLFAPPAVRAAYLTTKRLRKGIRDEAEWAHIAALAREDPQDYRTILAGIFGPRVADRLTTAGLEGSVPHRDSWRDADRVRIRRRLQNPLRVARIVMRQLGRLGSRIGRPTGLYVLVVGPDGCGKSSLAAVLPDACAGLFRRDYHSHWRPGLLPRPGSLAGRSGPDPSRPHDRAPHGVLVSFFLLTYYWIDFLLGGWLRLWPAKVRSGLVIVERGWWDLAVHASRWVVRALGRFIPEPDLVLVLDAPAVAVRARKAELPAEELERQRRILPIAFAPFRVAALDATKSLHGVARDARERVVAVVEERAVSRLGSGWVAVPPRTGRFALPRAPRRVATAGVRAYQPVTLRGRLGWESARAVARVGGFRLLPRATAPSRNVRAIVGKYVPRGGTFAVARANSPGRHVALILDGQGECRAVAKVASTEVARHALAREAEALRKFGPALGSPLQAPRIIDQSEGCLLLEPVRWHPRSRPWLLPEEVAAALGTFFRNGASDGAAGRAHGDFAPWNVLATTDGWTVLDWEEARTDAPPFYDLFHYLVQSHALLGRPSRNRLLQGLEGLGWVASAIRSYANASGTSCAGVDQHLLNYLRESGERLAATSKSERAFVRRAELVSALKG
jgi:Phosphotransferase enzyme family